MKIIWTRRASQNLGAAVAYIEQDNPAAAERFRKEMTEKAEILAEHPNIGRIVPDLPDIRQLLVHENYHVFYRVRKDEIPVVSG